MSEAGTVAAALTAARSLGLARLDAQALLGHLLDRPRGWLIAHDDAALTRAQWHGFEALAKRRAAGEPLAYLVGEKEFHGLRLAVDRATLVPRPETELLVDWAIECLPHDEAGRGVTRMLDLGTGSGAVALAVKRACPSVAVTAVDVSAAALAVARRNGERLHLDVEWLHSDWWSALGQRRFDLVLSNPPYVAEGDPHLHALAHEPALALTSGPDGLDALSRLAAGAGRHLAAGGRLLLEHGHEQAAAVRQLLSGAGFHAIETRLDLAGHPRCSGGVLQATPLRDAGQA
jgi:release factor glutamine methyltransferase